MNQERRFNDDVTPSYFTPETVQPMGGSSSLGNRPPAPEAMWVQPKGSGATPLRLSARSEHVVIIE